MIDYVSKLKELKTLVKRKDFSQIKLLLDSSVWEQEFYGFQIADDENWFDILSDAGVLNFKDFQEEVKDNEQTYRVMWGPFYYLNKIFAKIPDKVMPIFAEITNKHINKESFNLSWYVSQILHLISENLIKLSVDDIKKVLRPFQINCKHKDSFYVTENLFKIIEYLMDQGEENFVRGLLTGLLSINGKVEEEKVEFYSWQDYPHLIKRIDDLGFFKKHPSLSLKIFIDILKNAYSCFSQRYKSDSFNMDYIFSQDIHYFGVDMVIVRQLTFLIKTVSQDELNYLYSELLPLKNHQIVQSILCYFAAQNEEDMKNAYKILLEFSGELSNAYFGTSDYDKLVMKIFGKLKPDQKEAILNKRESAYKHEVSKRTASDDIKLQTQIIRWFFMPFKDNLPPKWQDKYGDALKDVSAEEYMARNHFEIHEINEYTSSLNKDNLNGKSLADLIAIIDEMTEKDEILLSERWNIQGTTKLIAQYINDSKDLLKDFNILEDNNIFLGIHNEILWNISFEEKTTVDADAIKPFIHYLKWISDLPEKPENIIRKDIYYIENSSSLWIATNNIINNMLLNVSGLDEEDYCSILEILLNNLEKDDDLIHKKETDRDYYSTAINSLWGTALMALIRLGLKASDLPHNEILPTISNKIFELLPQKNAVIYSILGRYYPWLQYIVGERLSELRKILFDKADSELFVVSFGTYLNNRLYFTLFDELKEYYLYAAQSNVFVDNNKLIYMGDALGDHLGILLYKQKITTDDDLGKALLNSPQLLHRAIWWIVSSLAHDKIADINFSDVKEVLSSILKDVCLFDTGKYKGTFDSFAMLLESEHFKEDEQWMIQTASTLYKTGAIDYKFYNNAIYKNLIESARNAELYNDIIDFLHNYLINTKYKDKYSPISMECPYYLDSEPINRIFEILLQGTLTDTQKDQLYDIFNTLSEYGFYHRLERFMEELKRNNNDETEK